MAEVLSPQRLSDIRGFEHEWIALREFVSSWSEKEQLRQYLDAVDWPRLLLAKEHGVLGQLSACLGDREASAIPFEIQQALLEQRRAQNFLMLRLTGELLRLLELFNRKEIRALVIKGPVLAAQAYGDPSLRSYGDLDPLVRQRDIRRTSELWRRRSNQRSAARSSFESRYTWFRHAN
jgi:Uncharacterised nucleotidyltransferase